MLNHLKQLFLIIKIFMFSILLQYLNMKNDNPTHQMRLSIDLRAIKDQQFTAQLSCRFGPVAALGISTFKSAPVPISNARVQVSLRDCFLSSYFQASASQIESKLAQKLQIELWHVDRMRKDQLLGCANIELHKIIQMPLRKTAQSFARVFDAYIPVDETNSQGKLIKTIASLRVIVYLQDLGPIGQLQQRGFNVKELLEQVDDQGGAPIQPQQQQRVMMESAGLNQLERKVVWELQTWKKAEQAKARLTLKQKQIQFWTNVSEQQRKSDLQKEKQFKKIQANLTLLEGKLRAKLAQLGKRQQKIMTLEQELQSKIVEVSRECLLKDQQIQAIKRRNKQQKSGIIKQKSGVEIQLAKLRAENARLRVQMQELKKQDEKSPLNILRAELNSKIMQTQQLGSELQKANYLKEQYKLYYDKMKDEVISLRDKLKERDQSIHEFRRQKDILLNNCRHFEQQLAYQRQMHTQNQQQRQYRQEWPAQDWGEDVHMSDRERLIRQRDTLLREAQYQPNDPLILELERQIKSYS